MESEFAMATSSGKPGGRSELDVLEMEATIEGKVSDCWVT